MATECPDLSPRDPMAASAAGIDTRWPEGSRGRSTASAEMKMSYSPAADFPVVEVQPRRSRTAEITGTVAGTVVRFTHDIRRDGAAATLRTWLQRYPALLVGAGIAGYLTGRMVRGR